MEGLKNPNGRFDDRQDLLSRIEKYERKVIPSYEGKVHELTHKLRNRPSICTSVSCIDVSKRIGDFEKDSKMNPELDKIRSELKRAEEVIREKDNEIEAKNKELREMTNMIQKMAATFNTEMSKQEILIRELNDEVVDLRGQIRVAIRVRDYEKDGSNFEITSDNEVKFQQNGQSNVFEFENVFKPTTNQPQVFNEIKELIMCALHGKNVSLIAFGPTSSGKTYTMRGDEENEGVIPRAINFMLEHSRHDLATIGWQYSFVASFIEVYNDEVFDLLDEKKKIKITGEAVTSNKIPIKGMRDVNHLLQLADAQRSVASTACNLHSSRSHAIFQIYIDGVNKSGETIKCSLKLVDLAGSERAKESGAQGEQFKELTKINQSLSTLKKCIRAQKNKDTHVPYRDSKLTILLRDSLGAGSSKTMFIAHVNPNDVCETDRTLKFTSDLRSTRIGKATVQTGQ
ncbi:hypothetical protein GCK72_005343 [Caenorhabditis remanei]|nr:hypothetical protein GCK72_005343 [Caenorhabditis remanei]KAF1765391.1 hypothetical protein GCK72_005343 [Caenorhabditis remanei]